MSQERIPLEQILQDTSLAFRDPLEQWPGADELRRSIARQGVLRPVCLLHSDQGYRPAAGFRRLQVLRELGSDTAPARVSSADPGEAFIEALEDHAGQPANLRERVRAVCIGERLGWSAERIARRVMPALGLSPHPHLMTQHARLAQLPRGLLDLLTGKGFSLRRCLPFCGLAQAEARLLARVALNLGLGGRQVEEVFACLQEIAGRESISLEAVVQDLGLKEAGQDRAWPEALEGRRYPELTRRRAALDRAVRDFADGRVTVGYERNLCDEGVELRFKVRDDDQLQQVLRALSEPETAAQLQRILELLGR